MSFATGFRRPGAWAIAARSLRVLAGLVLTLGLSGLRAADDEAEAPTSASCLECHADHDAMAKAAAGTNRPLLVDADAIAASAHGSYECVDCHEGLDAKATPHREKPVPVDCFSCHDDTGKKHKFHQRLALKTIPEGKDTDCAGCHGGHDIAAVKSKAFPFAKTKLTASCGRCHEESRDHFVASAHGTSLAEGDSLAPNCLTCHNDPAIARSL